MNQAKAIINLKEGIIQLEGPVEFVREYLELYRTAVGKFAGAPESTVPGGEVTFRLQLEHKPINTPEGTVPAPKKEVPARAVVHVRRRGGRTKRVSCADAIRTEVEMGFFAEPKSSQEVTQRLIEQGITCNNNSIRMRLKRLSNSGFLTSVKEGRAIRFHRAG